MVELAERLKEIQADGEQEVFAPMGGGEPKGTTGG